MTTRITKSINFIFTPLLLLTSSLTYAGSTGTVSYAPFTGENIPTLSGWMLIVLSLLLMVVAFRVTKNKNSGLNKFFITLIGVSIIAFGFGGAKLENILVAAPTPELSEANGGDADVFQNQLNTLVNTSGVTQQITNVDVSGIQCDNYVGDGFVSGECVAGLVVGTGASCVVDCSSNTGTITLIKSVINDDGGAADVNDFGLTIGGTPVNSGDTVAITTGSPVALDEAGAPGYQFVSITGDAACPAALGGTVTLASGQNITCTITNDDIAPTITLIKSVTNDDGGTVEVNDFGLTIGSTPVDSGDTVSITAGSPVALNEAGTPGYQFVSISGDAACPATLGGTVTLTPGQNITCTITNDDIAPTITLIKSVTNDDGGTAGVNDFGLTIGSTPVDSGDTVAITAGSPVALNEVGTPGYLFVSITGDAACPATLDGTVTLTPGQNITCTITNDDIAPTITLIKSVTNDDGGTAGVNDFGLTIGSTPVDSGDTVAITAGSPVALNEASVSGYQFVSITGDAACPSALGGSVTLTPGQIITCTITNDDIAPQTGTIIVQKLTTPAGGTGFGFTGNIGMANVFSLDDGGSITFKDVIAGSYSITEDATAVYTLTAISCDDANSTGNVATRAASINLEAGETVTCTFTNEQLPPVTVWAVKVADTDGDGDVDDFYNPGTATTPEEAQSGWEIRVYDALTNQLLASDETADQGSGSPRIRAELGTFTPGLQVKVCEVQQGGWVNTVPNTFDATLGLYCNDATIPDFIGTGPVTYNFFNQPPVTVWATKVADTDGDGDVTDFYNPTGVPEEAQAGWEIRVYDAVTNQLLASDTTADRGSGNPQIRAELGTFTPGLQVKVCEVQQGGWVNTVPSTIDADLNLPCTTATIPDFIGTGPVTYNFFNQPPVTVWATKVADTDGDGDVTDFYNPTGVPEEAQAGWEIRVYDAVTNQLLASDTTADRGSGNPQIRAELGTFTPGLQVKVCEVQQDGWVNTVPSTIDADLNLPCTTATIPDFIGTGPVTYNFFNQPPPP